MLFRSLWGCCIGVAGATQLAECLRVNATLTSLDLSVNNIGALGATQLAECLRVNTALTRLNLSGNGIYAASERAALKAALPPHCDLVI